MITQQPEFPLRKLDLSLAEHWGFHYNKAFLIIQACSDHGCTHLQYGLINPKDPVGDGRHVGRISEQGCEGCVSHFLSLPPPAHTVSSYDRTKYSPKECDLWPLYSLGEISYFILPHLCTLFCWVLSGKLQSEVVGVKKQINTGNIQNFMQWILKRRSSGCLVLHVCEGCHHWHEEIIRQDCPFFSTERIKPSGCVELKRRTKVSGSSKMAKEQ